MFWIKCHFCHGSYLTLPHLSFLSLSKIRRYLLYLSYNQYPIFDGNYFHKIISCMDFFITSTCSVSDLILFLIRFCRVQATASFILVQKYNLGQPRKYRREAYTRFRCTREPTCLLDQLRSGAPKSWFLLLFVLPCKRC